MKRRNLFILIIVLLLILLGLLIFYTSINVNNNYNYNLNNFDDNNKDDMNGGFKTIELGSNSRGTVELIGPIGNKNSNVKIAFIVGVHPLEYKVHDTLYDSLIAKSNSLNYCYYIYKINVTDNPDNYDIGRMNGQLLAKEFVVPDAISKNYDLVIDIHSNQGTNGGSYKETNFIFAPLNEANSKAFADKIIANIPPLLYYYPESQTSPNYVTIPIMKSGTPTIVYETYMYESNEITKDYINKLITTIDNLKY
ncbi:MAG: adhesin [Methanobrevibacter sp.]|nr:adhesin [Methanobrevibacter sp.]